MIVFLLWRHATLAPSHVLASTVSCSHNWSSSLRTSYWWCSLLQKNVLNLEPSSWCGEPFSWPVYWWTETRKRSRSSTYRNNWPSLDWVQSIIPKQLGSQSELIEVYLRAFQWRYVNRLTLIRTKTINQLNLLRKWRRKQSAQSVLWWLSLGKQHFEEIHERHHSENEKKSKTTLNAYWFRQILDRHDDECATQATFSLSYFDAMTQIVRAEPIPNDVKFHIILGQNWMKTQAKYDFFQKHHPISTSFCACCTKTLDFSHTK